MRAYLPAGTEVVIARGERNEWYTTRKEVDVTGYATAICPVRDGSPCLTAEVNGFRIWFMAEQVMVDLPEAMQEQLQYVKMVTVQYDIPVRVMQNAARYPDEQGHPFRHPSMWMWSVAARTSESVWIMSEERYQSILRRLNRMTRAGCKWLRTVIDSTDTINHIQRTVINLRNEWLEAEQKYAECMAEADERFAERGNSLESQKKLKADQIRNQRSLERKRENILNGAALLGIPAEWVKNGKVQGVAVANGSVGAAKPSMNTVRRVATEKSHTEAEAHVKMVDALKASGSAEAKKVAAEIEAGRMGHEYAADYCEENGILCDENGTFSLRGVFTD